MKVFGGSGASGPLQGLGVFFVLSPALHMSKHPLHRDKVV